MTNPKDPRSELEKLIVLNVLRYGNDRASSLMLEAEPVAAEIIQAVDSYVGERERLAEGRGRVSVISSFKYWADATEATYQQLMETELAKTIALKAERKDGV